MASETTELIVADILKAADAGTLVAPCTFTACYPRANVSAAFRVAKKRGLIIVDYASCMGTPVYRKALRVVA